MTGIKIVAAVVDTQQLILYKADGEKIYIPQGDPRIRGIVDQVMPILNAGGVAEISLEAANEYAAFEKKTSGLVRLFRVAKKAIAHLVGSDEERASVEPMTAGQLPGVKVSSIDEIMANAVPVSSETFKESETNAEETMVAVVGTGSQAKVVPGVEALKGQMSHANKLGSTKGVEALITRLSQVAPNRSHSVQDVLRFLERGDLPVAEDGSIIAYKMLSKTSRNKDFPTQEGLFFDCYTGRIPQKIGSYVCVDEKLVDRNRHNECSNGLHIARRGYLKIGTSGRLNSGATDVCVLIKLDPEDVMTVPHNDANKVRVTGYHVIGVIPDTEFRNLMANRPMTDSSECRRLLDDAITGQHVARLEQVKVTEQRGGGVVVTSLLKRGQQAKALPKPTEPVLEKNIAPQALALDDKTLATAEGVPVDPRAVSKQVQEQKSQTQPSRQQLAAELVGRMINGDLPNSERRNAAEALVALKKKSKVGYAVLGLTPAQVTTMEQTLKGNIAQKVEQVAVPKPAPAPKADPYPLPKSTAAPLTRAEKVASLVKTMNSGIAVHARINAAKELVELKKTSRQTWSNLGVDDKDAKTALDLSYTKTITSTPQLSAATKSAKKASKPAPRKMKRTTPKQPVAKAATTPVVIKKPVEKPARSIASIGASISAPKATHGGPTQDGPRQIKAKILYREMQSTSNSLKLRKNKAADLADHKKKSKVSWTALGLPQDMSKQIEDLLAEK